MSNGYKHKREAPELEAAVAAPKRRRTPPAVAPVGEGAAQGGRRGDGEGGGGGDERSVVELETDADGMDDGYRWAAARTHQTRGAWRRQKAGPVQ
jgi:hypothetical protein